MNYLQRYEIMENKAEGDDKTKVTQFVFLFQWEINTEMDDFAIYMP